MMKRPRIRELIDRANSEIAAKLTAAGEITVAFIERQHLEAMARCRVAGDRTNEREHLVCLGKMKGAYDVSLRLDLTVKYKYDERMAVEASRLARLALEEAGARGLGLPRPIDAEIVAPGASGEAEEADKGSGGASEEHTIANDTDSALPALPDGTPGQEEG